MCARRHSADDDREQPPGLADALARWDTEQGWMRATPAAHVEPPESTPASHSPPGLSPPVPDSWEAVLSAEAPPSRSTDPWATPAPAALDDPEQELWIPPEETVYRPARGSESDDGVGALGADAHRPWPPAPGAPSWESEPELAAPAWPSTRDEAPSAAESPDWPSTRDESSAGAAPGWQAARDEPSAAASWPAARDGQSTGAAHVWAAARDESSAGAGSGWVPGRDESSAGWTRDGDESSPAGASGWPSASSPAAGQDDSGEPPAAQDRYSALSAGSAQQQWPAPDPTVAAAPALSDDEWLAQLRAPGQADGRPSAGPVPEPAPRTWSAPDRPGSTAGPQWTIDPAVEGRPVETCPAPAGHRVDSVLSAQRPAFADIPMASPPAAMAAPLGSAFPSGAMPAVRTGPTPAVPTAIPGGWSSPTSRPLRSGYGSITSAEPPAIGGRYTRRPTGEQPTHAAPPTGDVPRTWSDTVTNSPSAEGAPLSQSEPATPGDPPSIREDAPGWPGTADDSSRRSGGGAPRWGDAAVADGLPPGTGPDVVESGPPTDETTRRWSVRDELGESSSDDDRVRTGAGDELTRSWADPEIGGENDHPTGSQAASSGWPGSETEPGPLSGDAQPGFTAAPDQPTGADHSDDRPTGAHPIQPGPGQFSLPLPSVPLTSEDGGGYGTPMGVLPIPTDSSHLGSGTRVPPRQFDQFSGGYLTGLDQFQPVPPADTGAGQAPSTVAATDQAGEPVVPPGPGGRPGRPGQPSPAGQRSAEPGQPGSPAGPDLRGDSGPSEHPAAPGYPGAPGPPLRPGPYGAGPAGQFSAPDRPGDSSWPGNPHTPRTNGGPSEPGPAGHPGQPGQYGYPGLPGTSGGPGEPGYPGQAGQFSGPGQPGGSGRPAHPDAPATGDTGPYGGQGQSWTPAQAGYPGPYGGPGDPVRTGYPGGQYPQPGISGIPGPAAHPVTPGQPMYPDGPGLPPGAEPPTVDQLTAQSLLRQRRPTPQTGWRRAVYNISAHALNPGQSNEDRRRQELIARASVPVPGCYRIAVISLKGGVGKTTTTVTLGATLASLRGDRVIAVDANPDRGTLSGKIPLETVATVRNLLNDVDDIQHYFDVRRYTSQSADRLEVLASESDPAVSIAFSESDYRTVAAVLERFYNIVLTDCGTGLLHSAMTGVLDLADQIVLVSSGSVDGARSASATLDWLEAHGRGELVRNSVAVINSVRPKSGGVDLDRLEAHFAARCRAVTRMPYDPHLEEGAEVDLGELSPGSRSALLELAAAVADAFPRDPRAPHAPPPPPET